MILHTNRAWCARCIGPFIVTGRWFKRLPPSQAHAVISHERGHLHGRHALKRLVPLLTGRWSKLIEISQAQEFQADEFCVKQGHAQGMLLYLASHNSPLIDTADNVDPWIKKLHPTAEQRIMHILKLTTQTSEGAVHGE
jgi:Zn-dependent protease with chaperone function